jgi:hypothetical protein
MTSLRQTGAGMISACVGRCQPESISYQSMSFQRRLANLEPVETCATLESAAWERYWDGFDLATSSAAGRYTGALYLLGYVVEIILKIGFFRTIGTPPSDCVQLRDIKDHPAWARRNQNLHDIAALARVLIAERAARGKAYDPVFAGVLDQHVQTLVAHWREVVRYRHTPALETEFAEVYQSTEWILCNRETLWR